MLIIPAIDLKGGNVVRLFQGKFDRQKIYSADPVKVAKHWVRQGAKFLHVVDLDGASCGKPGNLGAVKKILSQVGVPLEFGGGVRSIEAISGIDAKADKVLTQGWMNATSRTIPEFAAELKSLGFKQVIYTDVSRDGALVGPNIAGIKELIRKSGLDVIASGGISSLKDLLKLKSLQKKGVSGVIVGKALYEGKFTLMEAIALFK
jgi:phosphoribosylformimino-5-aminoimidazole carboxamide ribotide isomerase